jgi:hypothetical protein
LSVASLPTDSRSFARSRRVLSSVAPFVAFFLTLLLITLPRGLNSIVTAFNVPVLTWSGPAAKAFGGSDAGSLLNAAITLRKDGHIFADMFPVYDLWPPGMVGVDRVLLAIESQFGIPIVLSMVILNCAVWAGFLGFIFLLLRRWKGFSVAFLFGAGALLYSGVNDWGVRSGVFYSDSFGAIFYCCSLVVLLLAARATTRRRGLGLAALAGVFLAAASYFRASFELVADATLVVAAIVLAVLLFARWRGRPTGMALTSFLSIVVMSGVAQVVMLPWRAYLGLRIHIGDFRWSTVSDLTSAAPWVPNSLLPTGSGGFLGAGHSNFACLDDPVECKKIYAIEGASKAPYSAGPDGHFTGAQFNHFTFDSFLAHPFNYIFERIDSLAFGFASNTGESVKVLALPESLILVGLFIAVVVVWIRSRNFLNPVYLFLFFSTLIQMGTLALIHMEPRYFLGVELSILVIAPFILAPPHRRVKISDGGTEVESGRLDVVAPGSEPELRLTRNRRDPA